MSSQKDAADATVTLESLLATYAPDAASFDELVGPEGALRPVWRPVMEAFARLSKVERRELGETAERLLHENGVTFVAGGETGSSVRPWQLDMVPMLITPEEWQALESGLVQRARLLNRLLVDLYGPQRVLVVRGTNAKSGSPIHSARSLNTRRIASTRTCVPSSDPNFSSRTGNCSRIPRASRSAAPPDDGGGIVIIVAPRYDPTSGRRSFTWYASRSERLRTPPVFATSPTIWSAISPL